MKNETTMNPMTNESTATTTVSNIADTTIDKENDDMMKTTANKTMTSTEIETLLAEGVDTVMRNGRPITVNFENGTADKTLIYDLPSEDLALVNGWIKDNICSADCNRTGYSSYGLKHVLEHDTGVYLSNNQFKHAMLLSGYEPNDPDELNWEFNIVLTRDIIENPSPFFNWLKQYTTEDSMVGDFARDTLADRDFPVMADYWVVRRYLEYCNACDGYMHCFETAWKRWRNYKRNVKRWEKHQQAVCNRQHCDETST